MRARFWLVFNCREEGGGKRANAKVFVGVFVCSLNYKAISQLKSLRANKQAIMI